MDLINSWVIKFKLKHTFPERVGRDVVVMPASGSEDDEHVDGWCRRMGMCS